MYQVKVEEVLSAPIDYVFNQLVDHENYQQFPGIDQSILLEHGKDSKNGIGAQRRIKSGLFTLEETIVDFKAPNQMNYHITRSFPIKLNHILGQITLETLGDRTKVVWISKFEVKVPLLGKFFENRLGPVLTKVFSKMLQHIEKEKKFNSV